MQVTNHSLLASFSDMLAVIRHVLHRDAVNEDKRKDHLKLDNTGIKLKTSSSDGKVRKSGIFEDQSKDLDPFPLRAYSCHLPYATRSLEKITDCSVKGVS